MPSAQAELGAGKQRAYVIAELRQAIVAGDLLPNERLIEADLARRFDTSRAQIRSAIGLLEGEGLVVSEPNKGARVRLVSGEEAIEVMEARIALETVMAAKAAERATAGDLGELDAIVTRMRAAVGAGDLLAYSDLNGALHAVIARAARHATIGKLLTGLNSSIIRFRFRAILMAGRPPASLEEHEAIVNAITRRDARRAGALMTEHVAYAAEALRQAIAAHETGFGMSSAMTLVPLRP